MTTGDLTCWQYIAGDRGRLFLLIQYIIRVFLLTNAFAYFSPTSTELQAVSYRMFFFLAMIHYMVYCAWHYFPPKLDKAVRVSAVYYADNER